MGRELRRVKAGFDWPVGKIWTGFLNPHYQHSKKCPFCEGSGLNPETKKISDDWYDFGHDRNDPDRVRWCDRITQDEVDALVKHGRLMDFTHTWTSENGWKEKKPPYRPTAEEVNAWSQQGGFGGHDSINHWICTEARARRLGVYGKCKHCKGDGSLWRTPKDKVLAEAWKEKKPPKGPWYQMWETVSEGSPISPAFETVEELARWLADNRSGSVDQGISYDKWLAFIRGPGWAPSLIVNEKGVMSGVEAASEAL